ncbi:hypothetical protein C3F09_05545 [candidate division GN15 bacterium]|uniref:OmpA-like domain-containing protein n=1 Tax=candidate division GN15 bacterium TaxID=2072418 RepID=A0A855X1J7_9BACT|nr:MAG: hypothetical protein C3F09_05545 [candidate division GN15 bacterium]
MRRFGVTALLLLCAIAAQGGEYRYSLGVSGGILYSRGGDVLRFDPGTLYGGQIGFRLGERWYFYADMGYTKLTNNTSHAATETFGVITSATPIEAPMTRIGGSLHRLFLAPQNRFNLSMGIGGGAVIWKYTDPAVDTTFKVKGQRGQMVDFGASELFFSAGTKLIFRASDRISIHLAAQGDYLTGGGAEFDAAVDKARDRWLWSSTLSLNFHFGSVQRADKWPSDSAWKAPAAPRVKSAAPRTDSDNDGIPDDIDRCPSTPRGAVVDAYGCPIDSDRDGVPDGLDDCPGTPSDARGMVDVDGCPVDADFDGVPDYLDSCLGTPTGAAVNTIGCPIDSDKDGVPDGLDDCPNSLPGVAVDSRGCLDMSMFAKPMVFHIDYDPGGFEVDSKNKSRLEQLARVLAFVPELKLEINCYTDDIGTEADNLALSRKRALRIREYLIVYGVAADRLTANGRGETNFVASNQTADGRAKNRRAEITFYR